LCLGGQATDQGKGSCCGHLTGLSGDRQASGEWNFGLNQFCGSKDTLKISAQASAPGFEKEGSVLEYDFVCGETGMRIVSALSAVALSAFLIN